MCSERPFGAAAFAGGVFAAVLLAAAIDSPDVPDLLLRFPLLIVYFLVS
jgi:hypothetical protein